MRGLRRRGSGVPVLVAGNLKVPRQRKAAEDGGGDGRGTGGGREGGAVDE